MAADVASWEPTESSILLVIASQQASCFSVSPVFKLSYLATGCSFKFGYGKFEATARRESAINRFH